MPHLQRTVAYLSWLASYYREELALAFGLTVTLLIVASGIMTLT